MMDESMVPAGLSGDPGRVLVSVIVQIIAQCDALPHRSTYFF